MTKQEIEDIQFFIDKGWSITIDRIKEEGIEGTIKLGNYGLYVHFGGLFINDSANWKDVYVTVDTPDKGLQRESLQQWCYEVERGKSPEFDNIQREDESKIKYVERMKRYKGKVVKVEWDPYSKYPEDVVKVSKNIRKSRFEKSGLDDFPHNVYDRVTWFRKPSLSKYRECVELLENALLKGLVPLPIYNIVQTVDSCYFCNRWDTTKQVDLFNPKSPILIL
jgi:hypothetical protein